MDDEFDAFPNAPGLSKKLGLSQHDTLPPPFTGWGPWKRTWLSICSCHHPSHQDPECDLCRTGSYHVAWKTWISGFVFRVSPPLWRWWANR
jgi:hypothetical protein